MDIFELVIVCIRFLVGLGVLLYGVHILKGGLEKNLAAPLRKALEKVSDKPVRCAGLGFGVTAALQSSTASSIMVLGFTSAGILTLVQATGMLAGAVVGSTVSTLLLSFSYLKLTDIFMLGVFVGAIMYLFGNKTRTKDIGIILIGFGLMFLSLYLMSQSTNGLRQIDGFDTFLKNITNPFVLLVIGIVFTAIIQSSLGTAAILITLVSGGVIEIYYAAFIQFGAAIGTASTATLSAIGSNTNTKRVVLINLMIRSTGLFVMVPLTIFVPWIQWLKDLGLNPAFMVFTTDLTFALSCLIISLIFNKQIVGISKKVFKEKETVVKDEVELLFGIDSAIKKMPSLALSSVSKSMAVLLEKSVTVLKDNITYVHNDKVNVEDPFITEVDKDEVKHGSQVLSNFVNTLYNDLNEKEIAIAQNCQNIISENDRLIALSNRMRIIYSDYLDARSHKVERFTLIKEVLAQISKIATNCVGIVNSKVNNKKFSDFLIVEIFEADDKIHNIKTELKKANLERLKKEEGTKNLHYSMFYNLINILDEISETLTKIALTSL
ncbi:MAG: Na/Pi symporter [Firmicutes bacterium]|nr:Na/Pi symporter [Bacillota bacterium]